MRVSRHAILGVPCAPRVSNTPPWVGHPRHRGRAPDAASSTALRGARSRSGPRSIPAAPVNPGRRVTPRGPRRDGRKNAPAAATSAKGAAAARAKVPVGRLVVAGARRDRAARRRRPVYACDSLTMSESPWSMTASMEQLKYLPQAVPRSLFVPL